VYCCSTQSHKEFRFLLGIFPLIMHVCGCTLDQLTRSPRPSPLGEEVPHTPSLQEGSQPNPSLVSYDVDTPSLTTQSVIGSEKESRDRSHPITEKVVGGSFRLPPPPSRSKRMLKLLILSTLLIVNIPLALYTSLIHQRGTIDVMTYLYKETGGSKGVKWGGYDVSPPHVSVLFLMPCHSTPYYR